MQLCEIETAIQKEDLRELQRLATTTEHGLFEKKYRAQAWPLLLGIDLISWDSILDKDWRSLPEHKDEGQVKLDVERSFGGYDFPTEEINQLRSKLTEMITRVLRVQPKLSYYQGYHDVCIVFLLNVDDMNQCFKLLYVFSIRHLRDFMMPNFNMTIQILRIFPELISKLDYSFFSKSQIDKVEPFYALSPLITLFSHDIRSLEGISLIFDFVISYGSILSIIYIYVSLVLYKRDKILESLDQNHQESQGDVFFNTTDLIHHALSRVLDDMSSNDIDSILKDTKQNLKKSPPRKLRILRKLDKSSVLRSSSLFTKMDHSRLAKLTLLPYDSILDHEIKISEKPIKSSKRRIILSKLSNNNLVMVTVTIGVIGIILNFVLHKNFLSHEYSTTTHIFKDIFK